MNQQKEPGESPSLESLLANNRPGFFTRFRGWLTLGLVSIIVVTVYYFITNNNRESQIRYTTEEVVIGSLVIEVSATGNLQPTNEVEVGSELSGIIQEVFAEENDTVVIGQVLARLDLSKLEDAVARSRANLDVAKAQVQQAEASLDEFRANYSRLQQVHELSNGKVPSSFEMDAAQANLKRAEANLASAHASVTQANAALQSDETDLEKAQIRSPIDGIVLSREVDPGQTVAASFQAPILFTLAEDLTKMELVVDIDEADVGKVDTGQSATFSVDAWPDRQYHAIITKVGYGSEETDGVVSYPATLEVENDDLSLRPGMTASAEIVTLSLENILLVPNAALRYTPTSTRNTSTTSSQSLLQTLLPSRPGNQSQRQQDQSANTGSQQVWIIRNGQPTPIQIITGPSNGTVTHVISGDLESGMEVITSMINTQ